MTRAEWEPGRAGKTIFSEIAFGFSPCLKLLGWPPVLLCACIFSCVRVNVYIHSSTCGCVHALKYV